MNEERENQKRQFWVILTIVFLGFIGISMPYLIFPPLFLNAEYSFLPVSFGEESRAIFLGVTLAAYPFGQFIGSPILGALSDDYGRKSLLSGSLVVAAFCNLLTGIAISQQHLGMLIISRFMAGLMEGNVAIARAMCADLKALSKHETFGKINATISIAYLIGPFLGALIADKNFFKQLTAATPFFLICGLFFFLSILSGLVLTDSVSRSKVESKSLWQRLNFIARIKMLFAYKHLKVFMITSTCFTLAVDIFYEFGPVYLTVKWMLDPASLIFYNAVLCVGLCIGNGFLPTFVSNKAPNRASIIVAMIGFSLILTGIVLTDSSMAMFILFALCGLSIGLAATLITVKISEAAPDSMQGEVMGTQLSLRVLGDGLICLVGGALLILSPKIILMVSAFMALVSVFYYRINRV